MRRSAPVALLLLVVTVSAGCRLHIQQVRENNVIDPSHYDAIELGGDRRGDVMSSLGPPDRIVYGDSELIFDYLWMRHRGTDTRLFLPTQILPFLDPLFFISVPRYFFDERETPDEFRLTLAERLAQGLARLATFFIPVTRGQDLFIAAGHQLRNDRLRVVFDRKSLVVQGKSLRFASGEYRDEALRDRVLLRAD